MIFAQKLRISMLKRKNTILIKRKACIYLTIYKYIYMDFIKFQMRALFTTSEVGESFYMYIYINFHIDLRHMMLIGLKK